MAEPTLNDMMKAAAAGEPTKFADYFSGVMVDRVNDKVDQIRQAVADKIGGVDPSSTPAMELGPEEQGDIEEPEVDNEVELQADNEQEEDEQSDEEIETADGTTEED